MLGYIVRRLLLMIPTLLGITFLVFMLLAMAPGGIGAALRAAGGSVDADSKASMQLLYIEDRYGLDDPAVVQYGRWLGRISPVKFGERSMRNYAGDLEEPPRSVKPLPMGPGWFKEWYKSPLDLEKQAEEQHRPLADDDNPGRIAAVAKSLELAAAREEEGLPVGEAPEAIPEYKDANKSYLRARAQYLMATRGFASSISRYAAADTMRLREQEIARMIGEGTDAKVAERAATVSTQSDFNRAVTGNNVVDYELLQTLEPETSLEQDWEEVVQSYGRMVASHADAEAALARVRQAYARGPYPLAGVGIFGIATLDWPDFGKSFTIGRPVFDLIAEALPVTLLLNIAAVPIIYLVAVPFGMHAAARHNRLFDKVSGSVFVIFWSIPVVWAGVLAIGFLADKQYLGWFPGSGLHSNNADEMSFLPGFGAEGFERGYLLDTIWHMVLPVFCLVYGGWAVLAKQTRAAMLDTYTMDFVRTARAKGVSDHDVKWYHVFRNSLLPVITIFVLVFPAMLAGSVVVERIFSIPGMGSLILGAIFNLDRDVILANVFMIAVLNLLALLLADILYAAADPRVTFD